MLGVGVSVSILVGQSIGRGRPDEAAEAMLRGVGLSTFYVSLIAAVFLLLPEPLLGIFLSADQDQDTARRIMDLGVVLLRFVVAYSLFDGLFLCAFGALSGAGDVWYPMAVMGLGGIIALALPILLLFKLDLAHINILWLVYVFYILSMNIAVNRRYRRGHWRNRQVIEPQTI
jgi:MATE family multidrug resistance protein